MPACAIAGLAMRLVFDLIVFDAMFINRQRTSTTMQWGQTFEAVTRHETNRTGPIHTSLQHAFCGIYFDVRCKELLPIKYVEIDRSRSVRSQLGAILGQWQCKAGCITPRADRSKTNISNQRHGPNVIVPLMNHRCTQYAYVCLTNRMPLLAFCCY